MKYSASERVHDFFQQSAKVELWLKCTYYLSRLVGHFLNRIQQFNQPTVLIETVQYDRYKGTRDLFIAYQSSFWR